MSLYTEWRNLSDNHESQEAEVKFWEAYLQAEASIYNELLNNKQEVIEGKVSELAAKYNVSVEYFMVFIILRCFLFVFRCFIHVHIHVDTQLDALHIIVQIVAGIPTRRHRIIFPHHDFIALNRNI